jgi:hypothetical protein
VRIAVASDEPYAVNETAVEELEKLAQRGVRYIGSKTTRIFCLPTCRDARRIRQQSGHDVVLVAVTGWGEAEDRLRSKEAGFDHHLVKPIEPVVLERFLAEIEPQAA